MKIIHGSLKGLSPGDLQDVARRLALQSEARTNLTQRAGTFSGTSAVSDVDRRAQVRENPGTGG